MAVLAVWKPMAGSTFFIYSVVLLLVLAGLYLLVFLLDFCIYLEKKKKKTKNSSTHTKPLTVELKL